MLGSILSGAGSLLGALGAGESQTTAQQISGFESLPKDIQDYLTGDIFTRIQTWGQTPFPQVPYRRVDDREMDPIFGSRVARDLQALRDMQNLSRFSTPSEAVQDDQTTVNQLRREMEARDWVNKQRAQYLPGTDRQNLYNRDFDYAALGDLLDQFQDSPGFRGSGIEGLYRLAVSSPETLEKYTKATGMV